MISLGSKLRPVDCFTPIADRRGAVWLDSSLSHDNSEQVSLMAADPVGEIILRHGHGTITFANKERTCDFDGILHELDLIRLSPNLRAIGFIGYEATLPDLGVIPKRTATLPDVHFFIYDRVIAYNHRKDRYSDPELASSWSHTDNVSDRQESVSSETSSELRPAISRSDYLERVMQIKHHIHEGDNYQANFTTRYESYSPLNPFTAY